MTKTVQMKIFLVVACLLYALGHVSARVPGPQVTVSEKNLGKSKSRVRTTILIHSLTDLCYLLP